MKIIDEIQSIVARESMNGVDDSLRWRMHTAIAQLPGAYGPNIHRLLWFEYDIELCNLEQANEEAEILGWLRALDISAAPEVAAMIPFGRQSCVLVRRYWACPGERLLTPGLSPDPCPEPQRERYRRDMERVFEHGRAHPWARGLPHVYISDRSQTILMNSWPMLQSSERYDQKLEFLEHVDGQLHDLGAVRKDPIYDVFGADHVVLPVVHPVSRMDALASVEVAIAAGAKGIFTINQRMNDDQVLALISEIYRRHPTLWVGVNLLGYRPAAALRKALAVCGRIDGIWSDHAGIDEREADQPGAAEFVTARRELGWNGLYFGGVAFKYQREVEGDALRRAAMIATSYMDVVCTSGPGTGYSADLGKVETMREAIGRRRPLALASGITPDNITDYLPSAGAFLVGTGIESRFGVLDPAKLSALLGKLP